MAGCIFTFITQIDNWNELIKRYGGDPSTAQVKFGQRLATELDQRGVVDVLRRCVSDHNMLIRIAYFRPAHGLSDDLVAGYNANRLTVPHQLRTARTETRRTAP